MSYRVEFTQEALEDLAHLCSFLEQQAWERGDPDLPERALDAIAAGVALLAVNPYTCRKADDDPLERELIIPFGAAGYVALFRIASQELVVISALRHQREDDYH